MVNQLTQIFSLFRARTMPSKTILSLTLPLHCTYTVFIIFSVPLCYANADLKAGFALKEVILLLIS